MRRCLSEKRVRAINPSLACRSPQNRHVCGMGGELPVDCEVGQWEEWGICRGLECSRQGWRH